MNEWQKKMIDIISTCFDCEDCPLDGKECKDEDWANCEELLSHLLFQESYPNISEEKCKCKEKEESEETTGKESFADYVCRRFVEDLIGETPYCQEKENTTKMDEKQNGEIIVTICEMEIKGLPKDVATLIKLMNDIGR